MKRPQLMAARIGGLPVMVRERYALLRVAQEWGQNAAQAVLICTALVLLGLTLASAFGVLPWPAMALSFGGTDLPQAGMYVQILLTLLFVLLCFYLPANTRMARLERSHRSFAMGMEDVARAYRMAHAADRAGVFALSGEFDTMRARMDHLRKHPDLAHLEPEILQMAAQMSFETRALAQAYSDDKVARAKMFLQQRQQEVQNLADRIATVRHVVDDLKRWAADVDAEEHATHVQMKRIEADLRELLPPLGLTLSDRSNENVVALPKPGK
jgi:membrane protein implicated in regulation of membrane protease activity